MTIPSGWIQFEKANYCRNFEQMFRSSYDVSQRRFFPEKFKANEQQLEKIKHWAFLRHRRMAAMFLPNISGGVIRTAFGQVQLQLASIAIALELHRKSKGDLPASLEALAPKLPATNLLDPLTGKPFHSRRNSSNDFLLYSVGWNGTDEGGELADKRSSRYLNGDWVW